MVLHIREVARSNDVVIFTYSFKRKRFFNGRQRDRKRYIRVIVVLAATAIGNRLVNRFTYLVDRIFHTNTLTYLLCVYCHERGLYTMYRNNKNERGALYESEKKNKYACIYIWTKSNSLNGFGFFSDILFWIRYGHCFLHFLYGSSDRTANAAGRRPQRLVERQYRGYGLQATVVIGPIRLTSGPPRDFKSSLSGKRNVRRVHGFSGKRSRNNRETLRPRHLGGRDYFEERAGPFAYGVAGVHFRLWPDPKFERARV